MASVIECDGCHRVLKPGDPYLTIERIGGLGIEIFGARNEYDVCSAECMGQLAADLMEVTC